MAEIRLTPEQQKVVDTRNCNLLVAAAAGSGKTAVLVKRIIKKVTEEGQDIDRLLIVTFTNAAAAEMRERIGAAIEEALFENPENTHLQRQMLLLHNAQITTIHSFCLSVIREFFHLLSLDPGFRIGDEAELSLMKSDVLEEVLEEFYEREEADFLAFVESFGTVKNNEAVSGYIKKLYETAMSQLWPTEWLSELAKGFSLTREEFCTHPMFDHIGKETERCLKDCFVLLERMMALTEEPDGPEAYRDNFREDEEELLRLQTAAGNYEAFSTAISEFKLTRLTTKKQDCNPEKKELAKKLREQIKKHLTKLRDDFYYESTEELWKSITHMEFPMRGLIRVTGAFLERYELKKEENCLLDFNDLEHMALRILVNQEDGVSLPSPAAKTLSDRYDEIMIDEYQDSNLIQEAVLNSVSGAWKGMPNVFMVGDVKQSIYRFRMACPDLFMQKYETYGDSGKEQKIDLARNFRSRRCVLDAINVLFAGLMHKTSTEVEYDAAAALYFGASYPEEKEAHLTEVLLISMEQEETEAGDGYQETASATEEGEGDAPPAESGDGSLSQEEITMVRAEALAVAARIRELLQSDLTIGSEERPVDYGDIVILLRTMSGWSEGFLEVFNEQGIPAYADTSSGYFKSYEIRKMLDFLRILDNPKQDIPFAAVLHSPIAGLNAQELAELKVAYGAPAEGEKKNRCLYAAARMAAEADPSGKLAGFFAVYDRLRREAEYLSIHELVEHVFRYSGFYDAVTVMPGGERRRGNLDMLVVRAKQYESTSFSGLYDFIRYIDRLIKYEVDFGEANNGESGRMVRIMSIHKSKGLEFPVVFLCGMEKKMNRQDMRSRLIFHSRYGLGPEYVDTELRVKSPTLLKKVLAKQMNEEMIAEELRVLYVAMTRAREKLIMTGALKKPEKRCEIWKERSETVGEEGLLSSYVSKAETYFDFICPLLFATKKTCSAEEWMEMLETGIGITLTKQLEQEAFTGKFRLRSIGASEQAEKREEVRRTKEELLAVLSGLLTVEPETAEWAEELRSLFKQQTEYEYPYRATAELPVKVTVSELKRLALEAEEQQEVKVLVPEETEDDASYPEYLKPEKTVSGSDRGTIYHHVMELIPFRDGRNREELQSYLDSMVSEGKLLKEERDVVSDYKLWKFFSSGLGKRMCAAAERGTLQREQPFVLGLPAKELYPDTDSDEMVLVQGIIDAFFEEEDGLVLMDYKTDYIHHDAKEELTKKYKSQLGYYRKALERLKNKPVKEIWFYSFSQDLDFMIEE